jgi:hypothetical protein
MSERDGPGGSGLTREGVLDELSYLASVEHALCVEYLLIQCALGLDLPPADTGDVAQQISATADSAGTLAQAEMRHLHNVNRALVAADRPPQTVRAASISAAAASDIMLVPPNPAQVDGFLARLAAIASAVDARYARLRPAVASPNPLFAGSVLEQLTSILDPAPDHSSAVAALGQDLGDAPPEAYLRAIRHDPADDLERRLLHLSDRSYGLIVATVDAWFAYEDDLGGVLRGQAVSTMGALNDVNRLLVERGLLPAFTPPYAVP